MNALTHRSGSNPGEAKLKIKNNILWNINKFKLNQETFSENLSPSEESRGLSFFPKKNVNFDPKLHFKGEILNSINQNKFNILFTNRNYVEILTTTEEEKEKISRKLEDDLKEKIEFQEWNPNYLLEINNIHENGLETIKDWIIKNLDQTKIIKNFIEKKTNETKFHTLIISCNNEKELLNASAKITTGPEVVGKRVWVKRSQMSKFINKPKTFHINKFMAYVDKDVTLEEIEEKFIGEAEHIGFGLTESVMNEKKMLHIHSLNEIQTKEFKIKDKDYSLKACRTSKEQREIINKKSSIQQTTNSNNSSQNPQFQQPRGTGYSRRDQENQKSEIISGKENEFENKLKSLENENEKLKNEIELLKKELKEIKKIKKNEKENDFSNQFENLKNENSNLKKNLLELSNQNIILNENFVILEKSIN